MWLDNDTESLYRGNGGVIQAVVDRTGGCDWQWKVGVLQNGRTEWALGGDSLCREHALDSAKAMISLVEYSLESGGVVPCGW